MQALTAALQQASSRLLQNAIDAEDGYVNRLKSDFSFEVQLPSDLTLGRWERSFSSDPRIVSDHAAAFVLAHH